MADSLYVLIVDVGNTQSKMAVAHNGRLLGDVSVVPHDQTARVALDRFEAGEVGCCLLSSVASGVEDMVGKMRAGGLPTAILSADMRFRFSIDYATPHTLGTDRIAGIAGVVARVGVCDAIVIDAGTAITYDYLTADGRFVGGSIAPGIAMRFRALHEFTARLPLCAKNDYAGGHVGHDTRSAIAAGVVGGVVAEAAAKIHEACALAPQTRVFVTGGDYECFEFPTNISIFAVPNIVLEGLAAIAQDNLEEIIKC